MPTIFRLNSDRFFRDGFMPPLEIPGFEQLTAREDLSRADCLMVHMPSIAGIRGRDDLFRLRSIVPKKQIWIADSLESSVHYPVLDDPAFMALFDIEYSYRRTADVWTPYVEPDLDLRIKAADPVLQRNRFCCAFVSSGFNESGRKDLMQFLMERFRIDSFGKIYRNRRLWFDKGSATKLKTLRKYTYTLAFENSITEDYVTEKFFEPLKTGTIPIYLGAPNVQDFAPGENCYIDASRFPSFDALADYLQTEDPAQFHVWREKPLRPEFQAILGHVKEGVTQLLARLIHRKLAERSLS
ncbi:MAG: glycosyltransferase family 10 [Pseudomonadota bacterium]